MLTFLGVVFAAIAAWAAWRTASETKRMVQAGVILQIRQQFDELGALDRKIAPKDFDIEAQSVSDRDSNEAQIYRDLVKKYYKSFYSVMCLIKTDTIDKEIVRTVIFPFELERFLKIIKPLDDKLQVLTDGSAFDFWEYFSKQHAKN